MMHAIKIMRFVLTGETGDLDHSICNFIFLNSPVHHCTIWCWSTFEPLDLGLSNLTFLMSSQLEKVWIVCWADLICTFEFVLHFVSYAVTTWWQHHQTRLLFLFLRPAFSMAPTKDDNARDKWNLRLNPATFYASYNWKWHYSIGKSFFNPFATGDAYIRQLKPIMHSILFRDTKFQLKYYTMINICLIRQNFLVNKSIYNAIMSQFSLI